MLGLVSVVTATNVILRDAAIALDAQRRLLWGYVVAAAIACTGYFTLIPRLADLGAALGLLLGEVTVATAAFMVVRRASGVTPALAVPLRIVGCGIGAVAVGLLLQLAGVPWPAGLVLTGLAFAGLLPATRTVAPSRLVRVLAGRRAQPSPGSADAAS